MGARSTVRTSARQWGALLALGLFAVGTQVALEGRETPSGSTSVSWVRSPELVRRLTLGFNDLWADVYWIRAFKYFGST